MVGGVLLLVTGCYASQQETSTPSVPAAEKVTAEMSKPANVVTKSDVWMTDYDAALAKAKKEGKDLLVAFSGSDWCGWCMKLDKEVFSHQDFQTVASKNFILVDLDFPRSPENLAKIPEALQKRDKELSETFEISGFPTVLLIGSDGEPYARTGYQQGGVEGYLAHLKELRKGKTDREALEAKLKDKALTGIARAKLLDQIIKTVPDEIAYSKYADYMREIVKLDADNSAGLKAAYELTLGRGEAQEAMQKQNFKAAIAQYEKLVKTLKPEGEDLQNLLIDKGGAYFYTKDYKNLVTCLKDALEAAPKSDMAERIEGMIKRFSALADKEKGDSKPSE